MDNLKIWDITESCGDQSIYYLSYADKFTSLLSDLQDIIMNWEDEDILSEETRKYIGKLLKKKTASKKTLESIFIYDEFDLTVSKIYEGSSGARAYLEQFVDKLSGSEDSADIDIDIIERALEDNCADRSLVIAALQEISSYLEDASSFRRISI